MAKMRDISGQRFGKLVALYPTDKRQSGNVVWHCKCDCGNTKDVIVGNLTSGGTKSCGCLWKQSAIKDLTGQRFGKLTVLYPTEKRKNRNIIWHCQCDCGCTKDIRSDYLLSGDTTSCGCLKSKGEEKITQCLDNLKIKYETEKRFKDCINPKTKAQLRFDFFLPDYNCCIEYDGEQHFQETSMCNDTLAERQYRDNIKNVFCKENNIQLIRIPYTEYDKINNNFILKLLE